MRRRRTVLAWALMLRLLLGQTDGLWHDAAQATLYSVRDAAKVTASTGYDSIATTIVLQSGEGAKLPSPSTEGPFLLNWFNSTDYAAPSSDPNWELVKVTGRSGDTLTIVRGQGRTTAVNHNTAGKVYQLYLGWFEENVQGIYSAISGVSGSIPNVNDCSSYASCNALVTAIGTSTRNTMRVSNTQAVAANLSVTANYSVWAIGAGVFDVSTSVTLTFDRPDQIVADRHKQIFTGSGVVAFTKPGTVYPQWWGAVCDGTTDDGPEIQAALDSLPSTGGAVELAGCTYRSNQELVIVDNDVTVRGQPGAAIDITTIGGTGTANVHDSANVLAAIKVTGARVRIIGGRITGAATVAGKKTIGIWIAGATQTRVGGTKIENLHAGIWAGGNAVEPTIQNVELASNEHNLLLGYKPTSSSSPQVSRASLINVVSRNATVGDGVQLYSYTSDTTILGGQFYSNAGAGINGTVGGSTVRMVGASVSSNAAGGLTFTYNSLSGTSAGKLGFAHKLTIISSRFVGNTGDGVSIQLPDYSLFSTTGGIEDVALSDNLSEQNTGDGFDLGLVRSSVVGNRSLNNHGNCFTIRSNKSVTFMANQAWDCGTGGDNRRGFEFTTAATTGGTPPNSTLITFSGNQAGDTRSGGSRTMNYAFDLLKLDSGEVSNNHGTNANTADWTNVNGLSAVAFLNNRGAVTGANVIGTPISKILQASTTWDPASLLADAETSTTLTVTGAAVGDLCLVGHTQVTADLLQLSCYVNAADSARVVLQNISASTIDVASGTLKVGVVKP